MLNHTTYRYNLEIYTDKSNNIIHSLENRMLDQTMETFNLEIHNVKSNTRNICIYIYIECRSISGYIEQWKCII